MTSLQSELQNVQDQIAALKKAIDDTPDYSLGEGDPAITNREVNRALLERLREREEALKQAMSETGQNGYGICEQCGKPIHPDRLAVLPDTQLCIECARKENNA